MPIYCYSIPIGNYEGDGVFFKQLYFEGDSCPNKELFFYTLEEKFREEQEYYREHPEDFLGCIPELQQVKESLQYLEGFPWLGFGMIQTNSFINHPKLGKQPVMVTKIIPWC